MITNLSKHPNIAKRVLNEFCQEKDVPMVDIDELLQTIAKIDLRLSHILYKSDQSKCLFTVKCKNIMIVIEKNSNSDYLLINYYIPSKKILAKSTLVHWDNAETFKNRIIKFLSKKSII